MRTAPLLRSSLKFSALLAGTALGVLACTQSEDTDDAASSVTVESTATTPPAASSTNTMASNTATGTATTAPTNATTAAPGTSSSPLVTPPTTPATTSAPAASTTAAPTVSASPTDTAAMASSDGSNAGGAGGTDDAPSSSGTDAAGGTGGTDSAGGAGGTGAASGGAGGMSGGPAGDEDLDMTAEQFSCIGDWQQISGFRINNLLGHLDEAVAVANNPAGGKYPVGTILQHLPTEAMVKRREGFSPESKDWEFFLLSLSADGVTTITERGTTEIKTSTGDTCVSCHSVAPDMWDFVCNTYGDSGDGDCTFDFPQSFLDMQLAGDTRCK